jgi:thiopeptide-type bacteriocin biosynthesis protein
MSWQAFHIYYSDSLDNMLTTVVEDEVKELISKGAVDSWFFLRYWEGGPHLRFRLKLKSDVSCEKIDQVKNETIRAFDRYLDQYPSKTILNAVNHKEALQWLAKLEGVSQQMSSKATENNTISVESYHPELNKYGGINGVQIAESLFQSSSHLVLNSLGHSLLDGRRMGLGFTMFLTAMKGWGMDTEHMIQFLKSYSLYWARYASQEFIQTWTTVDSTQLKQMRSVLEKVLISDGRDAQVESERLEIWFGAISDARKSVINDRQEILSNVRFRGNSLTEHQALDYLILNYIHTHNNRLGIFPANEAKLAYLAHQVLVDVSGLGCRLILGDYLTTNNSFEYV